MSQPIPFEDLCAVLLAIAGHDPRQPLQLIVGAPDKLARSLRGIEQREELSMHRRGS
jgi:hypothetical protein